jgi:hypothetical protein
VNRTRIVGVVAVTLWMGVMGRPEDDAVSYDERHTQDGEEEEIRSGPAFSGDVRVRAREVLPTGSTFQAAPTGTTT